MTNEIKYKGHTFIKYISNRNIEEKCKEIASKINKQYKDQTIMIIGVLDGCFPFMSTMLKYINVSYKYDFIKIKSYLGTQSKELKIHLDINKDNVYDNNIIIIEDIVDSGKTIEYIKNNMAKLQPQDLKVISLLAKPNIVKIIDWYGFIIDDKFVIGYGMDIDGNYRDLNDIYIKK